MEKATHKIETPCVGIHQEDTYDTHPAIATIRRHVLSVFGMSRGWLVVIY